MTSQQQPVQRQAVQQHLAWAVGSQNGKQHWFPAASAAVDGIPGTALKSRLSRVAS